MAVSLVEAHIPEALAVWQGAAERASGELARMDERKETATGQRVNLIVNGVDISRLQFGDNTPTPKPPPK